MPRVRSRSFAGRARWRLTVTVVLAFPWRCAWVRRRKPTVRTTPPGARFQRCGRGPVGTWSDYGRQFCIPTGSPSSAFLRIRSGELLVRSERTPRRPRKHDSTTMASATTALSVPRHGAKRFRARTPSQSGTTCRQRSSVCTTEPGVPSSFTVRCRTTFSGGTRSGSGITRIRLTQGRAWCLDL